MPRGGRPLRTAVFSAGPSTPITTSSRFSLLQEMMNEDNAWESGSDGSCCSHSPYDNYRDSDDDTVASMMLTSFLGPEPRSKKMGKGKAPAPKKKISGGSKTPPQQQRSVSEKVFTDEDQQEEMPIHQQNVKWFGRHNSTTELFRTATPILQEAPRRSRTG